MSCQKKVLTFKIFVAGPFHAGKTTFVHYLDKNAQSVERKLPDGTTTTIVFDLGHVWWNGCDKLYSDEEVKSDNTGSDLFRVMLMGSPGQIHMSPVREATSKGAQGVMFILDSTAPGQIGHALAIFEEVKSYLGKDVPMVVVANKQDLQNSKKADVMKGMLKIDSVQFFDGSALTGQGIREATLALLKIMKERGLMGS